MKTKTVQPKIPARRSTARESQDTDQFFRSAAQKVLRDTRVAPSRMFGSTGFKVGGKVFAMLVKGNLVVKLPAERVADFIASGQGARFDPGHGRLMKEWVSVASNSKSKWSDLLEEAKDFVANLS